MKLVNNTVFITGGSSGIGLELCKVLLQKGNQVITCGKSPQKLQDAKSKLPGLITYPCDLSNPSELDKLVLTLRQNHLQINVLINNAAIVNRIDFLNDTHALELGELEYQTNLIAPVKLIQKLYPGLKQHKQASIINITTGLIYAPRVLYPFYNSSKAALHSFTQTLRIRLKSEHVDVTEVMFPAVNTPWHQGNPPSIAISTEKAVNEMIKGLEKAKPEIRVGGAGLLYMMSRLAPSFALSKVNQIA